MKTPVPKLQYMEKHPSKPIFIVLLVTTAAIAVYALWQRPGKYESYIPNLPATPIPTTVPDPRKEITVTSPNGEATLGMIEEKLNSLVKYTFTVDGEKIFTKTASDGAEITIPFNTFSPDNRYILLKEKLGSSSKFFVIPASPETTNESDKSYFTDLFTEKYPEYEISDVTGWGGINLVIINTQKSDGTTGPSFWYEVPSGRFIKLSNIFN